MLGFGGQCGAGIFSGLQLSLEISAEARLRGELVPCAREIPSTLSRRTPGPITTGFSFAKNVSRPAFSIDHAVWVAAFSGTTTDGVVHTKFES
jgi:hypothetical protein